MENKPSDKQGSTGEKSKRRSLGCLYYVLLLVAVIVGSVLAKECGGCVADVIVPSGKRSTPDTRISTPAPPMVSIPIYFQTFTSSDGLFSISYPREWEADLSQIEAREELLSDPSARIVFFGGKKSQGEHNPTVGVTTIPAPEGDWNVADLTEAVVKKYSQMTGLTLKSRVQTTVYGRQAALLDIEFSTAELGFGAAVHGSEPARCLQMFTRSKRFIWIVNCVAYPSGDYMLFKDDFQAIAKSFVIFEQ